MESQRLLSASQTASYQALLYEGQPVVVQYDRIHSFFVEQGKTEAARMFAKPVLGERTERGYRAISWYSDLQGDMLPLEQLQGGDRPAAEEHLRRQLNDLRPYLQDSQLGPILRQALVVPSLADVQIIFGQVVLVNWGLAPTSAAKDEPSLARHWAATLGIFCDYDLYSEGGGQEDTDLAAPSSLAAAGLAPPPPLPDQDQTAMAGEKSTKEPVGQGPTQPRAGTKPHAGVTGVVSNASVAWYQRNWAWLACAVVILAIGLLLGRLLFCGWAGCDSGSAADRQAMVVQQAVNQGLEREITSLEKALQGNACNGPQVVAPDPSKVMVTPSQPPGAAQGQEGQPREMSLAQLLEKSTVLVIGETREGIASGSGFFIAPDTIVTNWHVVEGLEHPKVTSENLGKLYPAKTVALGDNNRDFAVLKVRLDDPAKVVPLALTIDAPKLTKVTASGYPGDIIKIDPKFRALLHGQSNKAPNLILTQGVVNSMLDQHPPIVIHTAVTSQGNSGGPLVDEKGRIVGINTWLTLGEHNYRQVNMSIASKPLLEFLRANGQNVMVAGSSGNGGSAAANPRTGQ